MSNIIFAVYNLHLYSGASSQALRLAENLREEGLNIFFVNMTDDRTITGEMRISNFVVFNIHGSRINQLISLYRVFRSIEFKILHSHGFFSLPILFAFLFRKKVILKTTLNGQDDFHSISRYWSKIDNLLLQSIDVNNTLTSKLKVINSKIRPKMEFVTIPNGVELVSSRLDRLTSIKQINFLYVGAVVERKRVLETVKFFIDNYSFLPNSKLTLVGPYEGTPEINTNYVDKVRELISDKKNIAMLGMKTRDDLSELYASSLAILLFSEAEGMPNVILEGMAHNCVPITSSMDGAIDDIILDGSDGFVVNDDLDNAPSLEKIKNVHRLGNPRKKIESSFSFSSVVRQHISLYKDLECRK